MTQDDWRTHAQVFEDAIAQTERWLATKPVVIWGRAFDIDDEESRRWAAVWFITQLEKLLNWVETEAEKDETPA